MEEKSIEQRVHAVLMEEWSVHETQLADPGASLGDDLGIDSLDGIQAAMALEDEFEIVITDEDVEESLGPTATVGGVVALVTRLSAK
jgi:acyl carrier protein